jgi:lipid II:glycine glycyltransferase (peptidoglycan interpeptide bridge formation enzyme)
MTAGKARLFFAKDQKGKRIAGALIFTDDDYWYYSHSASLNEARKLQVMPPFLSFIILEAKKAGAKKFDLYGVADPERADHQLASITKFKQSFGGSLVQYSGTWDFPVNSLKYYIYRKIKKIIPKVN